MASAAPAQAYNLYPRKGTIAVGSDADLAVVDLELEQVVTTELCRSAQDHTPFEGIAVKGQHVCITAFKHIYGISEELWGKVLHIAMSNAMLASHEVRTIDCGTATLPR